MNTFILTAALIFVICGMSQTPEELGKYESDSPIVTGKNYFDAENKPEKILATLEPELYHIRLFLRENAMQKLWRKTI